MNECNCKISVFVKKNNSGWSLRYRCEKCLKYYNDWQVIDKLEQIYGHKKYREPLGQLKSIIATFRFKLSKLGMPFEVHDGYGELKEFFINKENPLFLKELFKN